MSNPTLQMLLEPVEPTDPTDPLHDLLRTGAQRLIASAIEAIGGFAGREGSLLENRDPAPRTDKAGIKKTAAARFFQFLRRGAVNCWRMDAASSSSDELSGCSPGSSHDSCASAR